MIVIVVIVVVFGMGQLENFRVVPGWEVEWW